MWEHKGLCGLLLIIPSVSFANLDLITWKGIFYNAQPIKPGITKSYCEEHTPGEVIHTTKQTRNGAVMTNKGIKLDRITLTIDKVDNIYLLHGELDATYSKNNKYWKDHIYYYHYKYSEAGTGKGVWYSPECKGNYLGIAIKNDNKNISLRKKPIRQVTS